MAAMLTVGRPFLVLTRQPSAADENNIGMLSSDEATGISYFVCAETHDFLHLKRRRERVARRIVSQMPEGCLQVFVVVHKDLYQFVYAQLGLADELLKLLYGGVHIVVAHEQGGRLMARIREVIERKRKRGTLQYSETPLIEAFEDTDVVVLKDLVDRVRYLRA